MTALIALSMIVGVSSVLYASVHFCSKWVDKMFHFNPTDPSKPIIRPPPK